MKGIEKRLKKKVKSTSELKVTDKDLQDVAKKRKNWSVPGLDGITNYLWKTLTATRKPLARAMQKWVDDNRTIPQWIAVSQGFVIIRRLPPNNMLKHIIQVVHRNISEVHERTC